MADDVAPEEAAPPAPLNPAVEEDAKTLAARMNETAPAGIVFEAVNNPVDAGWVIQGKDGSGNLVHQVLGTKSED